MALLLKSTNDIVTLQVELAAADQVIATLQFLDNGKLQSQPVWRGDVVEFGLVAAGRSAAQWWKSAQLGVPPALRTQLVRALAERQGSAGADYQALWIHLLKPYGALRFVPWERDLAAAQELAVLMLPDFIFPPPRESAAELEIALCASVPLDHEHSALFDDLLQAIAAIGQGVDRPFRLHVFADGEIAQRLRTSAPLPAYCLLHSPADAAAYVASDLSSRRHDRSGSLRSPWLLWMRDALRSYSTDVVHFIGHGHLAGQSGALLMAQSPLQRSDNYLAGPVGGTELASFLTQVGAWSTMFTSAQDNHNPLGLRALADEIAQTLPGPMLLFDPRFGSVNDLAAGYRFIHSPQAVPAPRTAALYLYCQPYLLTQRQGSADDTQLTTSVRVQIEQFARNDSQRDTALRSLGVVQAAAASEVRLAAPAGKSISAVTAATERLAEQVQVQYQKLLRDEVVPEAIVLRDLDSAMQTVNQMREAVGRMEQQRLLGEIGTGLDRIESLSGESISAAMEILRDVSATAGFDKNVYIKAIDAGGFDKGVAGNRIGDGAFDNDAFGKIVDGSRLGRGVIAKEIETGELYKDGFDKIDVPSYIDSAIADIFRVEASWGQLHQLAVSRPGAADSAGAIDLGRIEARITTLETRLNQAVQGLAPAASSQPGDDDNEESA